MGNVRVLYADWYSGVLRTASGGVHLARQYDHLSTMVVFENAPALDNYYLIVKMKETADGEVKTMEPIKLAGTFWLVPNTYTQLSQYIEYQVCCKLDTDSDDYENHSVWFKSMIVPSMSHEGKPLDVDPTVMFEPYRDWVTRLAMAAGAIVIDPTLLDDSENPVQNKVVTAKLNELQAAINACTLTEEEAAELLAAAEGVGA